LWDMFALNTEFEFDFISHGKWSQDFRKYVRMFL